MSTTAITSTSGSSTGTQVKSSAMQLKPEDFINLMVTQLQNQDPMQPASNSELLSQMSQIGQLQSSSSLQDTLKSMVLQNQIGSASSLIGKVVTGTDSNQNPISGLVNSVHVTKDAVSLELDNGQSLDLANVTNIAALPKA